MFENSGKEGQNPHKNKVHKALAYSYSLFFFLFLAGVFLEALFPLKIFNGSPAAPATGFILIVLATILIFWAQRSNRSLDKKNLSKETFSKGPYRYIKHPTQSGLVLFLFGFGITADALYLIIIAVFYAGFAFFFFFKKQDRILEAKYGEHYKEYEKSVKLRF